MVAFEVLDKRRRPRSLLLQPFQLILPRVRIIEDPVGVFVERRQVARARGREAADGHAADTVRPFGILVFQVVYSRAQVVRTST